MPFCEDHSKGVGQRGLSRAHHHLLHGPTNLPLGFWPVSMYFAPVPGPVDHLSKQVLVAFYMLGWQEIWASRPSWSNSKKFDVFGCPCLLGSIVWHDLLRFGFDPSNILKNPCSSLVAKLHETLKYSKRPKRKKKMGLIWLSLRSDSYQATEKTERPSAPGALTRCTGRCRQPRRLIPWWWHGAQQAVVLFWMVFAFWSLWSGVWLLDWCSKTTYKIFCTVVILTQHIALSNWHPMAPRQVWTWRETLSSTKEGRTATTWITASGGPTMRRRYWMQWGETKDIQGFCGGLCLVCIIQNPLKCIPTSMKRYWRHQATLKSSPCPAWMFVSSNSCSLDLAKVGNELETPVPLAQQDCVWKRVNWLLDYRLLQI